MTNVFYTSVCSTTKHVEPEMCRPDVLQAGESDLSTVGQLMRFVFLSNFTGHPAISVPVGLSTQGMLLHLLKAFSTAGSAARLCRVLALRIACRMP